MVYFILDTLLDTFLDTFFGQIFCALTLTVFKNLHQYSWFDNCVITNIEVANIVYDMQNLLTLWWLMHCGKLPVTVWFVDKHLTSWFSVWCGKLQVTVWYVNRHLTFCVSSTDIVCGVENFRSPCDTSTDILCFVNRHCVWYGKLTIIVCTNYLCGVENLLT